MLPRYLIALCLLLLCAFPASAGTVRLVFTGDIMVHKTQLAAARLKGSQAYDFDYQFALARPFLRGDAVVGNLETVLAGAERRYTGYPDFNSPDELAAALRRARFDTLMLANNHTFDRGSSGAARTVRFLRGQGFRLAGLSITPPLVFDLKGMRIGMLNATYGTNGPLPKGKDAVRVDIVSQAMLADAVRELRLQGADCVVACLHWGEEYRTAPNAEQRKQARWALDAGADLIVGSHPHVLQPVEHTDDGRLIFWSMGNFVSGQRTVPRERTIIAAVDLELSPLGGCRIADAGIVPAAVLKVAMKGREAAHGFVVVPAGMEHRLEADGARRAAAIHRDVLSFLGITGERRTDGFWRIPRHPVRPKAAEPAKSTKKSRPQK